MSITDPRSWWMNGFHPADYPAWVAVNSTLTAREELRRIDVQSITEGKLRYLRRLASKQIYIWTSPDVKQEIVCREAGCYVLVSGERICRVNGKYGYTREAMVERQGSLY